jgi:hypothetical protein
LNCGAYTSVFAEFWAVPLPTIMYVSQGMARVLFGHENQRAIWKELYDLDIEPRN